MIAYTLFCLVGADFLQALDVTEHFPVENTLPRGEIQIHRYLYRAVCEISPRVNRVLPHLEEGHDGTKVANKTSSHNKYQHVICLFWSFELSYLSIVVW